MALVESHRAVMLQPSEAPVMTAGRAAQVGSGKMGEKPALEEKCRLQSL